MKYISLSRPNAQSLALFSLVLWLASLPLVGVVLYSEQRQLSGFEILKTGWASVFTLNFAWLSNLLFFAILFRVWQRKETSKMAILAFIISLDTFRLNTVLLNEAGHQTNVYGYGWGAILWFCSFAFLMIGAIHNSLSTRNLSVAQSKADANKLNAKPILLLCCLGFALLVISVIYFSIQDRRKANPMELYRLHGIAFKRGPVCSETDPPSGAPLKNLRGPLKIVDAARSSSYSFSDKEKILDWGVPAIRTNEQDFYYRHLIDNRYVFDSRKSTEPLSGTLYVTHVVVNEKSHFGLRLVEAETDRIVFNRVWVQEVAGGQRFCPDFSIYPNENEQPRKVLIEAFGSPSAFLRQK